MQGFYGKKSPNGTHRREPHERKKHMNEHIYDMIIIGGGPAGYTAALYASRAGMDTLVIERMSVGGQMSVTDVIDNYPGFPEGVDGFTLGMKMQESAARFGAKTEYASVTAAMLDRAVKELTTDRGIFYAKTVVIATGAEPRTLGLSNEGDLIGRGVHYCAHCDGRFYKGKTVAVIGGGNSAVGDALYLSRLAEKVYLIHRRDTLRATDIYHKPLMQNEAITFLKSTAVTALHGDGKLNAVTVTDLKSGEEALLPLDGVFVSIGRAPTAGLFAGQINLDDAGYIVADETTCTSLPGVFAIGDVRTKPLRQVVTAVADGAVAVEFAEKYLEQFPKNM